MTIMSKKTSLLILIVASFAVHFAFFGQPNETVFDEVHFGKFVSSYYTGQYHFDIHPPLGKLIIAGFARVFDFRPEHSFAEIGQPFPDSTYLSLRFLPMLAGALLPIVIYFLALTLGFSTLSALGAGILITLENALLTQSRYILLDSFLLLFGFSGLLFYFQSKSIEAKPLYRGLASILAASIGFGLAASIKWTGLTFLMLAGLIELISLIKNRAWSLSRLGKLALFFAAIPLAIYFAVFTIHFSLLKQPGEGDAFMTQGFQQKNIIGKFLELNWEMYESNATLTASHPYSSEWYTWPFMTRTIYYWIHSSENTPTAERIYLIGNPFIWWTSTIAVLYALLSLVSRFKDLKVSDRTLLILLAGWALNYFPFIAIGRVMFLYHYFTSLIFAILILAYLIDHMKRPKKTWLIILAISAVVFIYFAPLSYGLPLEAGSYEQRVWLPSWR